MSLANELRACLNEILRAPVSEPAEPVLVRGGSVTRARAPASFLQGGARRACLGDRRVLRPAAEA
jgi:hypothetical protein